MQEIKLWYNAHRKNIWIIVGIIAAIIVIVQFLNFLGSTSREKENNSIIGRSNIISNIKNETNVDIESTSSAITGEEVPEEVLKGDTSAIGKFMDFCNQGKVEEAYNMLTNECKENVFNTLEAFQQGYYQDIFDGQQKIYTVENLMGKTYKVRIMENMLATGKSNDGYSKQDYITVKEEDGEDKLNINNYIGHTDINKTTEKDEISMQVISKEAYMDYEEYKINVTNNKDQAIVLDGRSNVDSLYLEDSRGQKYSAYTHELTTPMLNLDAGSSRELTIKFYNRYGSNKTIEYIVFSDLLVSNYQGTERTEFKAEV